MPSSVLNKARTHKCRREDTVFTRLKLGHTGLNVILCRINKAETDKCGVCEVSETVEHALLECARYSVERQTLRERVTHAGRDWNIEGLLGIGNNQK